MHLIVSGFGSYGDVLPMVGLGAAMRARGHRVQAICNPYFRQVVENAGLELLPLGTAEEYLELAAHPDLWHPQRGLRLVMERGAAGYLRETYALVEAAYRPGETVLAAHGIDLASRIFHERHGAPMATVHFAPFALPSLHDTPRYMGAGALRYAPRWLKAATLWASSRWIIDPVLAPTVNALRRDVGLPPIRGVFYGWNHSPQLVLGMFPDWYGAPQPDWPPQTYQAGFPLWDQCLAEAHLPEEVEEFLAAGEPPIVFAPGSANVQAGSSAPRSRRASAWAAAASWPPSTPTSCPESCPRRCGTSASCRSACCCRARRRWCTTAASAPVPRGWPRACRRWSCRWRSTNWTTACGWRGWGSAPSCGCATSAPAPWPTRWSDC
ncbi:MAG TPA: glycosyltransferase [Lacipirellulaceae bacterium]|nr:glycosyltransferase [Lacipirellulaceae bacterium]